jgi:hypothetical protein
MVDDREKCVQEDMEGNDHGQVQPTIPTFARLDSRNSENMPVRIASVRLRFETQTRLLPHLP